nr:hypothetical protein [Patescibacteria group bacterium]
MNNQKIEKIITEIISIDDEMKKFEKEIRSIAHTFSKSQPNLEINDNFKNNLKHNIMNEINKIKKDKKGEEKKAFNWMIFSKKLAFSLGAIALLIAIIIPLKNNLEKNDGKLVLNNKDKQEQTEKFVRVEDSAFGKIALSTNNSEGETKTPATVSADNTLTSNEEANRESSVSVLGLGAGTGGEIVASNDSRILPYPYEPINYEFDYVGDDFELNGEKVDVYKKIVKSLN